MTDFDSDMPDRDDECPDVWHIGAEYSPEQRCPNCGWCEDCGVSCDCELAS